ncbi:serine/threonine protein kinase [Brevibacillus ginsengisoli]|uniref:serine/threonine protein kinase n=1 Tax=Brevibacillus ginsengisoli TaxID=363854 RepID=UPI003CEDE752
MSFNRIPPFLPKYLTGKWHGNNYQIVRELGSGANGTVYLAQTNQGNCVALKIGADSLDLFMEVNMLREIKPNGGIRVGPYVIDVDDIIIQGQTHTFYVMEYVEGERLDHYIAKVGTDWVPVLIIQLLTRLYILHHQGWIFGDLKPENIMVVHTDKQLRLIDFGGVTKIGNAVRQFTEEYDRAAWLAGDRRASVTYDLFSLAVMMVKLMIGREEWKKISFTKHNHQLLCDIIRSNNSLYPYRSVLMRALEGKYTSVVSMRQELVEALQVKTTVPGSTSAPQQDKDAIGKWIGGIFAASLLLLAGSLYYLWM